MQLIIASGFWLAASSGIIIANRIIMVELQVGREISRVLLLVLPLQLAIHQMSSMEQRM